MERKDGQKCNVSAAGKKQVLVDGVLGFWSVRI